MVIERHAACICKGVEMLWSSEQMKNYERKKIFIRAFAFVALIGVCVNVFMIIDSLMSHS